MTENIRSDLSIVRIWSMRTTPLVFNPDGKMTLKGQGRAFEVTGQTKARFDFS